MRRENINLIIVNTTGFYSEPSQLHPPNKAPPISAPSFPALFFLVMFLYTFKERSHGRIKIKHGFCMCTCQTGNGKSQQVETKAVSKEVTKLRTSVRKAGPDFIARKA